MEFSDFSCPFCKEYHVAGVAKSAAEKIRADYALKILPNKKREGSEFLARAAKCVSQKSGSGAYSDVSDAIFSASGSSAAEAAYASAEKSGLGRTSLDECAQSVETNALVAKDSGQGMYLKIRMTPSVLVLDNESGAYVVFA